MKVIAVTPAGRRRYLELLAKYVLSDEAVAEWHLWDNCRDPADRAYLQSLTDPRIKIVSLPNAKGDNRSINKFYRTMTDPDAFYVKLGGDICYLPPGFSGALPQKPLRARRTRSGFRLLSSTMRSVPGCCHSMAKSDIRNHCRAWLLAKPDGRILNLPCSCTAFS
jgi:hypothetical protein